MRNSTKEIKWTDKTPLALKGEYLSDSAFVTIDSDGVIQYIRSDPNVFAKTLSEVIENYVNDQIEIFCYYNHISNRAWKKRGVIIKNSVNNTELLVDQLCYKTPFKACKHEIKFGFNILKQRTIGI